MEGCGDQGGEESGEHVRFFFFLPLSFLFPSSLLASPDDSSIVGAAS